MVVNTNIQRAYDGRNAALAAGNATLAAKWESVGAHYIAIAEANGC